MLAAALSPTVIPLLFGSDFSAATTPAAILAFAGVPWAGQWILSRSAAAAGEPNLLVVSFAVGLAVMLLLDLALVPALTSSAQRSPRRRVA